MKKAISLRNINFLNDKKFGPSLLAKIVVWLFILGVFYLFLFPFIYLISTSFQSAESISDPSVLWIPNSFSFDTIKVTMGLLNYKDSVFLTLLIAFFSTLFSVISCSLVGYGFARFKFPGKGVAFGLVILTIILPVQAVLIPNYLNFRFFDFGGILKIFTGGQGYINLVGTPFTFILPAMFACGLRGGLFTFIFRQTFAAMPKELEEAAKMDGCNSFRTFIRIMFPLAKPAIITVGLFSFVWHWNDLYTSAMYFVGEVRPIMPMLNDLRVIMIQEGLTSSINLSQYALRLYFASGALLALIPPLILYIFLQRYFVESIAKTGIVG